MTDVATTEAVETDTAPVPYEEQARAIAEMLFPVIDKHSTPQEAGIVGGISATLAADPMLLAGLVGKTLFASPDESPEQAQEKAQEIARLEAEIAAARKVIEDAKENLKTLDSGETPRQFATREFLQAGLKAFLNPTNHPSATLPYEKFGMQKPEVPIRKGRPAGSTNEAKATPAGKSDFVHTSKHE